MRTAKSLSLLLIVGLSNAALVYGCSSDTNTGTGEGDDASTSTADKDSGREASSIVVEDAGGTDAKDASKDAKKDVAKDTATADVIDDVPPDVVFDPPGSPCGPVSSTEEQACGTCGTSNRVCLKQLDAGAADAAGKPGYWSPWSSCNTPASAVCDPLQTYTDEACGNCGTRQRVCQLDCTFVAGLTCQNEGECALGSVDWEQGLGCNQPLGRVKTCDSTCAWDPAATCTTQPPNPNNIILGVTTPGTVVTKTFAISKTLEKRLVVGMCPTTLSSSTTNRVYVEVKNTTAQAMHVSIWSSKAATNPITQDTVMAVFAGGIVPKTDAERANCILGTFVSDDCDTTIGGAFNPKACVSSSAGLLKGDVDSDGNTFSGVAIPANGSVTVWVGPYLSSATGGNVVLSAKVEGP